MSDMGKLLLKYESLIRATAIKYSRHFRASRHIGNVDDHIAEARIAAWKALESYQTDKQTKLETYMIGCIKNRMIDLERKATRKSRPDLTFLDDEAVTALADVEDCFDQTEAAEDRLVLAKLLDADEFSTVAYFLDGGGMEQLVSERCRKSKRTTKRIARMEIVQCLRRIQHKLQSNGLSLSV